MYGDESMGYSSKFSVELFIVFLRLVYKRSMTGQKVMVMVMVMVMTLQ